MLFSIKHFAFSLIYIEMRCFKMAMGLAMVTKGICREDY